MKVKPKSKVKSKTKVERIRELLEKGLSVSLIAKTLKCSPSYVYAVHLKKKRNETEKKEYSAVEIVTRASSLDVQVGGQHYKEMAIQPIEYIHRNAIGFAEGTVIKYVSRWRAKGGVEDLRKARHVLDMLIEMERE